MLMFVFKIFVYKILFILAKDLDQNAILGTLFITQIYPFTVNNEGIITKIVGQEVINL